MSICLGIDIGVTGAVSSVDHNGRAVIHDLPTVSIPGERFVRRRIDGRALMELVRSLAPAGESVVAVIENVHTWPGSRNSPQAQGSLMDSRARIETVLELARIQVHAIEPLAWKRLFGLAGKEKADSIATARTLYPGLAETLRLAKHHNRAEALLLAHYGARKLA
jgi:hypothetical protein